MPPTTPNDPGPSSPAPDGQRERAERLEQPRQGRREFFMDMPRAGARERLAAAELKRRADR